MSDCYIKNMHSFVRTLFDLQEIPLFLAIYNRTYQYKPSVKLFVKSDKRKTNFRNWFVRLAHQEQIFGKFKCADWGQIRTNKFRTFFFCTNFFSHTFLPLTKKIKYCFWLSNFQLLNYNLTAINFCWYVGMMTNRV